MQSNDRHTSLFLLLFFIAIKVLLHYIVINPVYGLHRDEFLHLDMSGHLAAGYLSVPPFTAFNSLLIKWLGNSFFWVRFFPVLYGVLTLVVIWKMVSLLEGKWFAQVLAASVFICSGIMAGDCYCTVCAGNKGYVSCIAAGTDPD